MTPAPVRTPVRSLLLGPGRIWRRRIRMAVPVGALLLRLHRSQTIADSRGCFDVRAWSGRGGLGDGNVSENNLNGGVVKRMGRRQSKGKAGDVIMLPG